VLLPYYGRESDGGKRMNDDGTGTSSGLARAIKYAADMGADVLSNSWEQPAMKGG